MIYAQSIYKTPNKASFVNERAYILPENRDFDTLHPSFGALPRACPCSSMDRTRAF